MSLHLFDTQLVSYAINGSYALPCDAAISSVTAQELLLVQGNKPMRNNYYIPKLTSNSPYMTHNILRSIPSKYRGTFGMRRTDRLVFDFGADYPTVIEYSHQAIAAALNDGNFMLLEGMARALEPERHRVVVRRLSFLSQQKIHCVALSKPSAETGLQLFREFIANFTMKRNFRNSLNDILTLAIAEASSSILHTDDELLARFAGQRSNVPINRQAKGAIIDFTPPAEGRRINRGTKGYINYAWRVRR